MRTRHPRRDARHRRPSRRRTRRTSSPALSGIVVPAGNPLTVTGTDLDLTMRVTEEAIGLDDGSCVVPARLVADIVRPLEPGAVTFAQRDDQIDISAARSRFELRTFPVVEFPAVGRPSATVTRCRPRPWPRRCARWCGPPPRRRPPLLTGVLLAAEEGAIRLVATDSYRLAMRDLAGEPRSPGGEHILVPARALTELQRPSPAAGRRMTTAPTGSACRPASTSSPSWQGTSRSPPGCWTGATPTTTSSSPTGYPNLLHLGKESLLGGAAPGAAPGPGQHHPGAPVDAAGRVELTVVSQEVGDASETVDGDFEGEELTIAFNPSYLIDGVEAVQGDEVLLETRRRHQAGHGAGSGRRRLPLPAHARSGVLAPATRHRPTPVSLAISTLARRLPLLRRRRTSSPTPRARP